MNNSEPLDVIIIGAGQAGLSTSYLLSKKNINHVVLEKNEIGDSWKRRWDSFMLNSPNFSNLLPEQSLGSDTAHGFVSGLQFAERLQKYADENNLPVKTHSKVLSVDKAHDHPGFSVEFDHNGKLEKWHAHQVVIASGGQIVPVIPMLSQKFDSSIFQIHSNDYRNPSQLPDGAVLIVGSATSGVQIAEDLLHADRKVYLSTSAVARTPRRYRGRDIMEWMTDLQFFEKPTALAEPFELSLKAPLMSGVGENGHTISLQSLHKQGVTLLGYLKNVENHILSFEDNVLANIQFGDQFSAQVKGGIEQFISMTGMQAKPIEEDEADEMADPDSFKNSPLSLDCDEKNITSVIWTTGFTADFSWVHLPITDDKGRPVHDNGISPVKNLYFMGLPWQRNLKSSLIYGTAGDAEFIANSILENQPVPEKVL